MKIKLLMGLLISILTINSFSTEWKYQGGLDGGAGLMIVYKSVPPIKIEVDEPETMVVPRGKQTFKYTEVSKTKEPLAVKIEVQFDPQVVSDNGVNKNIIRTMYNRANLSFEKNGEFELNRIDDGVVPKNQKNNNKVEGRAFFTNKGRIGDKNSEELEFIDTIQNGLLTTKKAYIDAEFNRNNKELLSGVYKGKVVLMIELLGKPGGNGRD